MNKGRISTHFVCISFARYCNSNPQSFTKIVMKTLGERDYAAQETMHHLLSLKLHSSRFTVIPVSLNGSCRVQISADERQLCCGNSLLDVYANRTQYDSPGINTAKLNFVQFQHSLRLSTKSSPSSQIMWLQEFFPHILQIQKAQTLPNIIDTNPGKDNEMNEKIMPGIMKSHLIKTS